MSVDDLLDELDEMVDKAWSLPLSHGRAVLDGAEVKQILDEIRASMPKEVHQAKAIVADRTKILDDARREAETVVHVAQERAKALIAQNEITRQAQERATEMTTQSQAKIREMRKASNDYIDDLMKRTDDGLAQVLAELRRTRQNIRASQRSGKNGID